MPDVVLDFSDSADSHTQQPYRDLAMEVPGNIDAAQLPLGSPPLHDTHEPARAVNLATGNNGPGAECGSVRGPSDD